MAESLKEFWRCAQMRDQTSTVSEGDIWILTKLYNADPNLIMHT